MSGLCTECTGAGEIRCATCGGSGAHGTWQWPGGGETAAACASCHGQGRCTCPACRGTGKAPEPRQRPSAPQLRTAVCWTRSAPATDCDVHAVAELDGQEWKIILVGDAVPFYRLLVAGEAVVDFEREDWPGCWTWRA